MGVNIKGGITETWTAPSMERWWALELNLPFPSVGATENILLAAVLAEGTTVIHNAAREPEIQDLAGFLTAIGGKNPPKNDGTIVVEGVETLLPEGWSTG